NRNYIWIFGVEALAYFGKVIIHPTPAGSLEELFSRMAIGVVPGEALLAAGVLFHGALLAIALRVSALDRQKHKERGSSAAMG
ncbi:MAG: DUF2270 domain-containing protein, partial [Parvularculaceae bacterium]